MSRNTHVIRLHVHNDRLEECAKETRIQLKVASRHGAHHVYDRDSPACNEFRASTESTYQQASQSDRCVIYVLLKSYGKVGALRLLAKAIKCIKSELVRQQSSESDRAKFSLFSVRGGEEVRVPRP